MAQVGDILYEGVLDADQPAVAIDLKQILPLGTLRMTGCQGEASLNGKDYQPLSPGDGNETAARHLRFSLKPGEGRGEVCLQCGSGFIAQEEPYWTAAYCRREQGRGWRGGDGVYSLVTRDAAAASQRKTLFTFGDTLISGIREDDSRELPLDMVNNTCAILTGLDPEAPGGLRFHIQKDSKGRDTSLVVPAPGAFDYEGAGLKVAQTYYWMQDWALTGEGLVTFPMLLTEDKTQPEGYQFRLLGTALVRVPLQDGEPDFTRSSQHPLNLHLKEPGREILYGAGVLRKNLKTVCDGFIYLYGYITRPDGRFLCVSRVPAGEVEQPGSWTFFDGRDFVPDIAASAPLINHVSTELSMTFLAHGPLKGKYLLVYQHDTNSAFVAVSVADSPTGPFSTPQMVYCCPESGAGQGTYTYNAKLHEPLSNHGSLIVSYNVNTTVWQEHVDQALLYRPRFLSLRHTAENDWDRLFANAYRERRKMFRWLNQTAQAGATVFAGDSLIQEFPLQEFFPGHVVYNRGIGGDTTLGLLQRLEDSVIGLKPARVFLLSGANDLLSEDSPEAIAGRILEAARAIRDSLPGCSIHVLTLPPVNQGQHPLINPLVVTGREPVAITAINRLLKEQEQEGLYTLVDAHSRLMDDKGRLKLHFTQEGLHLSPEGYGELADLIRPYLKD